MEPHVRNYFRDLGYDTSDTILCEVCQQVANSIHHVVPRSAFGSKRKAEQDDSSNLCALCDDCHRDAHGPDSRNIRVRLQEIIKLRALKKI